MKRQEYLSILSGRRRGALDGGKMRAADWVAVCLVLAAVGFVCWILLFGFA